MIRKVIFSVSLFLLSASTSIARPIVTLAEGLSEVEFLEVDGDTVYFNETYQTTYPIRLARTSRVSTIGGPREVLAVRNAGWTSAADLKVHGAQLYWGVNRGGGNGSIHRYDLATGIVADLVNYEANQPRDIAVDNEFVYWSESNGGPFSRIRKVPTSGGEIIPVTDSGTMYYSLAADNTDLYFGYYASNVPQACLGRASKSDGTGQNLICGLSGPPSGIAFWGDDVFWVEAASGTLRKISKNGGGTVETLLFNLDYPVRLAIWNEVVYITENAEGAAGQGKLRRYDLHTGASTVLTAGLNSPYDVDVDEQGVYWTERGLTGSDGLIRKWPLNPSGPSSFRFSLIPSYLPVGEPFSVTITAEDEYGRLVPFDGQIYLAASLARVKPNTVTMSGGTVSVELTLDSPSLTMRLIAHSADGIVGESNTFVVNGGTMNGSLSGKVLGFMPNSDSGAPLDGAEVHLNDGSTIRVIPVVQGKYATNSIPCGSYRAWASYNSTETLAVPVEIPCGRLIVHDFSIPLQCDTGGRTPILLLPGLLGSSINTLNPVPVLPAYPPKWNDPIWPASDNQGLGGLHQVGGKADWKALADAFGPNYQIGCTLFPVPYDWRLPIDQIAESYLVPWINEARRRTGASKVHVVAHSMGGLVARSYIQSNTRTPYRGDIDRLVMLGTPNQGAPFAYYPWSGGDPMLADRSMSYWGLPLPPFYTLTSLKAYWDIERRALPPLGYRGILHDFYRRRIRSLGQLLPTYSFLGGFGQPLRPLQCEQNDWLQRLNEDGMLPTLFGSSDFSGVRTTILRGVGLETVSSIPVGSIVNPCSSRSLYADGIPKFIEPYVISSVGDGTVPQLSVPIPGVDATILDKASSHTGLIKAFRCEVVEVLTDESCVVSSQKNRQGKIVESSALTLIFTGRAQPYVTDSQGRGTGLSPGTGELVDEIPGSHVTVDVELATITLQNPAGGDYQILLTGNSGEVWDLSAEFSKLDHVASTQVVGVLSSEATSFSIRLETAEPGLSTQHSSIPPSNVRTKFFAGSLPKTRIEWDASHQPDVVSYRIYARRIDEPSLGLVATTSATYYDSQDSWAGEPDITPKIYAVSAVNGKGTESFLAGFVANDDRDHDGLSDGAEVGLGSPLDDPDADDDGLSDGDEYGFGTDLHNRDSDGDRYPDGLEVSRGSDPLDADATPGLDFYTVTPCRLLDTRLDTALQSGTELLVAVAGKCGVPSSALAVAVNVTAANSSGNGNIALFPSDLQPTNTSTVNYASGVTRANNAVVPLSADALGRIKARAFVVGGGQVHLVIDVSGYFN